MTRKVFDKAIRLLGASYRVVLSDETIDGYALALAPLSDEAIQKAVEQALRKLKYFPKPSELFDMASEAANAAQGWTVDDLTGAVVELIMAAPHYRLESFLVGHEGEQSREMVPVECEPCYPHPLCAEVVRAMGGWESIRDSARSPETIRSQVRKAAQAVHGRQEDNAGRVVRGEAPRYPSSPVVYRPQLGEKAETLEPKAATADMLRELRDKLALPSAMPGKRKESA